MLHDNAVHEPPHDHIKGLKQTRNIFYIHKIQIHDDDPKLCNP
jgi:hypothetical protein